MQTADAETAKAHKLMLERLMRKHAQDSRRRARLAAAVERLTRKERPGSVSAKARGSRGRRALEDRPMHTPDRTPRILKEEEKAIQTHSCGRAGQDRKDGCVQVGSYLFRIFLPGLEGTVVHEGDASQPLPKVEPLRASVRWCAYGWPVRRGRGGGRAVFINQANDVLASTNQLTAYSGKKHMPSYRAAFGQRHAVSESTELPRPGLNS